MKRRCFAGELTSSCWTEIRYRCTITDITNRLDVDTLNEIGVPRAAFENRDWPRRDFAVAPGGLRALRGPAATSAALS